MALILLGGPAAYAFAIIHGARNGSLTVAKGTLSVTLFGTAGYDRRLGMLRMPRP